MTNLEILNKAKAILSPTDPDMWCVDIRDDHQGNHCALGWLDMISGDKDLSYNVISVTNILTNNPEHGQSPLVDANNYQSEEYPQDNPKDRAMACLEDMIKLAKAE